MNRRNTVLLIEDRAEDAELCARAIRKSNPRNEIVVASDGVEVINAIALKLGRFGYERITWIGDPTLYQSSNDLALAVKDFNFDQGARYGDYEVGKDRLAAYGVAGLVGGIIAGKAANVGMLAALVVAGKKFAVVIGVGAVALLSRVKSLFRRKTQTS